MTSTPSFPVTAAPQGVRPGASLPSPVVQEATATTTGVERQTDKTAPRRRRHLRSQSHGEVPRHPRPITPPLDRLARKPPSTWERYKPVLRLAGTNLLTALSVGALFATKQVSAFQAIGIGKAGLLALYATPGGWAAVGCHTLTMASAIFGSTWGRSRATPDDPSGFGQFYARRWPAIVLGSTFALSGALGLVTTLPVGVGLALSSTYLSITAAQQSLGRRGSMAGDVTALAIASSFSVGLCFALGAGLPVSMAMLHATTLLAASMTLSLAFHLSMQVFQQEFPTPFIDPLTMRRGIVERTRMAPDLAAPAAPGGSSVQTVFQTPKGFADFTRELQEALRELPEKGFAGFLGQPIVTVCGEPGGGKSTSAVALAQALSRNGRPADVITVHRDDLEQNQIGELPVVALNLASAILECDSLGRRRQHDGPVVLLIEEIDSIFPKLDAPKAPAGQFDENFMKSLGFLFVVQILHLLSQSRSGVVVVATTNFAPEIRPLLDMLSMRAPIVFKSPTKKTRRDIILSQLKSLDHALTSDHQLPPVALLDDQDKLNHLLSVVEAREGGLSGRDLTNVMRAGARGAIAMQHRANQSQQEISPAALRARVYERIEEAMQHLPASEGEPLAGSDKSDASDEDETPARPTNEEVVANAERVLKRLHVSDMEAAEVFERLAQTIVNFGKRYADPTNTVAIAKLKLRLAGTVALFSLLQLRSDLDLMSHRQFRDVPEVSPLKSFFGGDSPKAWPNFGRSVKTWAALNSAAVVRMAHHVYGLSGIDLEQAVDRMRFLQNAVNHLPARARTGLVDASSSVRAIINP